MRAQKMRIPKLSADELQTLLNSARNVVDLESRAPPNKNRDLILTTFGGPVSWVFGFRV